MITKSFVTFTSLPFRTLTLAAARTVLTIDFLARLKLQSDLRTLDRLQNPSIRNICSAEVDHVTNIIQRNACQTALAPNKTPRRRNLRNLHAEKTGKNGGIRKRRF
jgi:hypothetical protein